MNKSIFSLGTYQCLSRIKFGCLCFLFQSNSQLSDVLCLWRRALVRLFAWLSFSIECFHMTSRRPYWCPKTMKRRPCWCPKPVLWELNSFLMQTFSFVRTYLHRCWPREWKHSILKRLSCLCNLQKKHGIIVNLEEKTMQRAFLTLLKNFWL